MKTNRMKIVFFITTLVLFSVFSFAQNTCEIKGKIVNSDKIAVYRATVTLLDLNTNEVITVRNTAKNGFFRIEGVTEGQYILSVAKPGFTETLNRYIMIDKNGQLVELPSSVLKRNKTKTTEADKI